MTEDAKVLEDGAAFEPTNRLRGLAAVEEFAEVTMSENGEGVSARARGNLFVPVDQDIEELVEHMIRLSTNTKNRRGGLSSGREFSPYLEIFDKKKRDRSHRSFACLQFATWRHMAHQGRHPGGARSHNDTRSRSPIRSQPTSSSCLSNELTLPL